MFDGEDVEVCEYGAEDGCDGAFGGARNGGEGVRRCDGGVSRPKAK